MIILNSSVYLFIIWTTYLCFTYWLDKIIVRNWSDYYTTTKQGNYKVPPTVFLRLKWLLSYEGKNNCFFLTCCNFYENVVQRLFSILFMYFWCRNAIDFKLRNLKKVSSEEFRSRIRLNFLKPNIFVVLNILNKHRNILFIRRCNSYENVAQRLFSIRFLYFLSN